MGSFDKKGGRRYHLLPPFLSKELGTKVCTSLNIKNATKLQSCIKLCQPKQNFENGFISSLSTCIVVNKKQKILLDKEKNVQYTVS
jgi:hypothetical protein